MIKMKRYYASQSVGGGGGNSWLLVLNKKMKTMNYGKLNIEQAFNNSSVGRVSSNSLMVRINDYQHNHHFHTRISHQRIKFEQAEFEVCGSSKSFSHLKSFLLMMMNTISKKSPESQSPPPTQTQPIMGMMDLLRRIDFEKLSRDYGIEPRSTFHEYNSNGNLMRLSRKPDGSVRCSAAVMALFVERDEKEEGMKVPYLVLVQKTPAKKNTNYQHAGQVSFPGGVFDENLDKNLLETAMRETFEEIGLKNIELLNQTLPSSTTGARNFNVQPFIGRILVSPDCENSIPPYHLQSEEIAHVFQVKVLDLISNPNICTFEPLGKTIMSPTSTHYGPLYHLKNIHSITHNQVIPHVPLWGYTATVVTHILDALNFELSNIGENSP